MCGGAGHACLGNARRNGTGRVHAAAQVFAGQTFCRRLHWPRTCGGAGFRGADVLQTAALAAHMRRSRTCLPRKRSKEWDWPCTCGGAGFRGTDVLQTAALAAHMRRRRFSRDRRIADGCIDRAHAAAQVFAGQTFCRRLHWPRTCGGAGFRGTGVLQTAALAAHMRRRRFSRDRRFADGCIGRAHAAAQDRKETPARAMPGMPRVRRLPMNRPPVDCKSPRTAARRAGNVHKNRPPHARMRGRSSWPASRRRAQAYLGQ